MTSQTLAAPARLDALLARTRRWWNVAAGVRPAYVLGALVGVQWIAVLALALKVRHNGWVYYAGGDQLWHYSGAYLFAHGDLPRALVGYGWSILLAPVAVFAGPSLASALPALVLFNTVVLLPIALLCMYGIGAQIAGRMFGYLAAALWIAVPYLGIVFVQPGYHQKYTELTLPQTLGLSSVPDFPSTVGLIVAAYLVLRAVENGAWQPAVGAGLAAGYAIAIKPSNAIFLFAPGLLILVTRWRTALPFVAGLAPALLTLALWKYRGLGELAAAPAEPTRLAAGGFLERVHHPELNSWEHLHQVTLGFREHFWTARVIEWIPLAGLTALLLRSLRGFLLVGTWFVAYLLVKGTYVLASLDDASFFRLLMPAFPAYVLLCASVVLLVPGVRARATATRPLLSQRKLTYAVGAAAVVFAVLPLGVVAATQPLHDSGAKAVQLGISLLPVSPSFTPHVSAHGDAIRVTWPPQSSVGGKVFYRILRGRGEDIACGGRLNNAAEDCRLYADEIGATRETMFVDHPGPGNWTYHVGISTNWLNDATLGDVYVLSKPVPILVP
ncbi:MAG: glycosyltransferase family 39 protein [Gaiellaceae bacterium]